MIKRGKPSLKRLSVTVGHDEIGSVRLRGVTRGNATMSTFGRLVAVCALSSIISACQPSAYPDLRTVSPPPDSSYPLEQRREIARELIEDRDLAQHKKAIHRHRSGLSDIPPPAAPASTATRAEDIVRATPVPGQKPVGEATESSSDRAYRDRAQFDDGTLDDFIRRLKRDTAPPIPAEENSSSDQSNVPKPQSLHFQLEPSLTYANAASEHRLAFLPVVFLAFAPATLPNEGPLAVRLAAAETDPGLFCSYLGWMVAWSNACLDQESVTASENDTASTGTTGSENDGVSDDVEDGAPSDQGANTNSGEQTAENDTSGSSGDKTADQSQTTPEDVAGPSEDIDGESLLPVSSTLDRLRNLIRSRNSTSQSSSSTGSRSLAYDAFKIEPDAALGPPLPTSRPEVEKDLRIVRNDRVFEFTRTPTPAFKPTPPEPKIVIFPPEKPRPPAKTTFHPAARPALVAAHRDIADLELGGAIDLEPDIEQGEPEPDTQQRELTPEPSSGEAEQQAALSDTESTDDTEVEAPEEQKVPAANEPAEPEASVDPEESEEPNVLDSEVIRFDPRSPKLPAGVELRLREMLVEARASNGKLFIISEAGIGNLAMERARSVGLALVRLGATADEIEYDIVVDRRVDQVRLLLKPNGDDPG